MARRDPSFIRIGDRLKLDPGRLGRTGIPEVVMAEGKAAVDIRAAAVALARVHGLAIVTRVLRPFPWGRVPGFVVEPHPQAWIDVLRRRGHRTAPTGGRVAILTAGAADRRVASEAEIVAREMGCEVRTERDVGVAGLHRVLDAVERLRSWRPHVYVVAAGREGALAPVAAGLVNGPVIGVPVSTGYGRGGRGEAALTTMLQSCAPLVTVNIDAGVIAGAVAAQIATQAAARGHAGAVARRRGAARTRFPQEARGPTSGRGRRR